MIYLLLIWLITALELSLTLALTLALAALGGATLSLTIAVADEAMQRGEGAQAVVVAESEIRAGWVDSEGWEVPAPRANPRRKPR